MFGGVPIRVISPPRMHANESGIRIALALCPALAAERSATGMRSPSVPTLFMKPETAAPVPESTAVYRRGASSTGATRRARSSVVPATASARPMTRTRATVTVAGWPKPSKAPAAGTRSSTTATRSAPKATTS